MPSPDDVQTIQDALKDLVTLLIRDLQRMWRLIQGRSLDAVETRDLLIPAAPELVHPYAASAAQLTATWYDQLAPESPYRAVTAPLVSSDQLAATTRWAVSPLFGPASAAETDDPLARLAGSMQRSVFDASRDTVLLNAHDEPGTLWARYASATACAFCRLLATRGAVYASEETATKVGQSGRVRGNRNPGDRYHDHCRCVAVPIRPGDSYEPPDYVNSWNDEYLAARRTARSGDAKKILREMRKNDL